MAVCLSGVLPDLSPEDKVVKRELVKFLPRTYSDLIRLNIPGSSGSRSSRPSTLRPQPPSVIKLSHDGPPATKPTKGELLARVETLSRKSRSMKQKTLDSPVKGDPSWGKVPKLGSSSSSPSSHVRVRGHAMPPSSEVPRAPSLQPRYGSAVKARDSSGRADEPPLEVMPTTVWSPPAQSTPPPSSRAEELKGKSPEADGDGYSLLSNADLAAGAVSSILRESDLKRSGVLPVEEALTLSLKGVTSVSFGVLLCLLLS